MVENHRCVNLLIFGLMGNILEFHPHDVGDEHDLGAYDKIRTSNFMTSSNLKLSHSTDPEW